MGDRIYLLTHKRTYGFEGLVESCGGKVDHIFLVFYRGPGSPEGRFIGRFYHKLTERCIKDSIHLYNGGIDEMRQLQGLRD